MLVQTKRGIIHEASIGYNKLSKKEKSRKLDSIVAVTGYNRGIVAVTGYNRDYASRLLSLQGKSVYVKDGSGRIYKLVADVRKTKKRPKGNMMQKY